MHDSGSNFWFQFLLESESESRILNSELESDFWINLESESESHIGRNRASLVASQNIYYWMKNLLGPPRHKNMFSLRILAIHGAKTTENQTPLIHLAWLFYNETIFQKSVLSSKTYQGGLIFSGFRTMYSEYP